jgi:DNA replication and repair protein RecF
MVLQDLCLRHYRNYPVLSAAFSPTLNILVGSNAQGKTNLLEAIGLLATTKSLRGSRDQDLIAFDADLATDTGVVTREERPDITLEVSIGREQQKQVRLNGVRQTRIMDFIGQFNAVSFSNADIEVLRGEPSLRRRFLDLEISQVSPAYVYALAHYRRVHEQRNRLLKALREGGQRGFLEDSLAAWDEQLLNYGAQLVERRRRFVCDLEEKARPIHTRLTEEGETLALTYECSFPLPEGDGEEIRSAFGQALREHRQEELRRAVSLVGPHRDDLLFQIDGRDARVYGSQGQQRTAALSTRLAEIELIRELIEEPPVCLLDDVLSELDDLRRAQIFDVTVGSCQTFLTCTSTRSLPDAVLAQARLYRVVAGSIESVKGES